MNFERDGVSALLHMVRVSLKLEIELFIDNYKR